MRNRILDVVGIHRLSESEPKGWVAPEVLFAQYRESVELNAAESAAQRAWMHSGPVHVPSDEIMQELGAVVFTHQPRLLRAGLLSAESAEAVAKVLAEYESWADITLWRSEDAMERAEWADVRWAARHALNTIDRDVLAHK